MSLPAYLSLSKMDIFSTSSKNSYRFIAVSDLHVGGWNATRPVIESGLVNSWEPDFIILTGDVVYGKGGNRTEWDLLYNVTLRKLLEAGIPIYLIAGNHEDSPGNGTWVKLGWAHNFTRDGPPYYSFDHKNSHFTLVYNGNLPWWDDSRVGDTYLYPKAMEQFQWIEEDLTSSSARWLFVVSHKGAYFNPNRTGTMFYLNDPDYKLTQMKYDEWLRKYRIDIFISGHQHFYENYPANGTLYNHVGAAFDTIYIPRPPHIGGVFPPRIGGVFTVYDVSDDAVRIRVINYRNRTVDDYVYRHAGGERRSLPWPISAAR